MSRADRTAVASFVEAALDALIASIGAQQAGAAGSALRQKAGDTTTNSVALLRGGGLFSAMSACFAAARTNGASFDAMERARAAIAAMPETTSLVGIIRAGALGYSLVQQALIVADTTFVSRQEADRIGVVMRAAFEASIEIAATVTEQETFRALIGLQAAVTRDLAQRAQLLPRVVAYALPGGLPSLALANRFYNDAARADELVAENRTFHPLFMAPAGRALSA